MGFHSASHRSWRRFPQSASAAPPSPIRRSFAGWLFIFIEFVPVPTIDLAKEDLLPNLILEVVGRWRNQPNSNWDFFYIGRFLSALILAWLGGLFSRWCYQRSGR